MTGFDRHGIRERFIEEPTVYIWEMVCLRNANGFIRTHHFFHDFEFGWRAMDHDGPLQETGSSQRNQRISLNPEWF